MIRPSGLFPIQNLTSETYEPIFGHLVGLLGRGISPSQCLYLHRTAQHRKTRTHIHDSSGIRTHDPNARAVEDSTCLKDCPATRTGWNKHQRVCVKESHTTHYGLDDRASRVRFPAGPGNFSPPRPEWFRGPLSLLSIGYQGLFRWG
jgi:hypothetical protein